jgi:hypothetical protein
MATIVLQVPDENLVTKVKQACKMLMGVTSVKVQKAQKVKAKPRLYDPETGEYLNDKTMKLIEDVHSGKEPVYHAESVDDMFQKILGYVPGKV